MNGDTSVHRSGRNSFFTQDYKSFELGTLVHCRHLYIKKNVQHNHVPSFRGRYLYSVLPFCASANEYLPNLYLKNEPAYTVCGARKEVF